jgi:hypothetical protein
MGRGLVVGDVLWVMTGVSGEAEREVVGALDRVLGEDLAGARVTGQVITVNVGLMMGAVDVGLMMGAVGYIMDMDMDMDSDMSTWRLRGV